MTKSSRGTFQIRTTEANEPLDFQALVIEKNEETEINYFDLVTKIVSTRVNEGSSKHKTKQRRCASVAVLVNEISGKNIQ